MKNTRPALWGMVAGMPCVVLGSILASLDAYAKLAAPDLINNFADTKDGLIPLLGLQMASLCASVLSVVIGGIKLSEKIDFESCGELLCGGKWTLSEHIKAIEGILTPVLLFALAALALTDYDEGSIIDRSLKAATATSLMPITMITIIGFIGWDTHRHKKAKKLRMTQYTQLIRSIESSSAKCPNCEGSQTLCIGIVFQKNRHLVQFGNIGQTEKPPHYSDTVSVHECPKCHFTHRVPIRTEEPDSDWD